jgi:hypothetical protein
MSTTNFIIDTSNPDSLGNAISPLVELIECTLIALRHNFNNAAVFIFSDRFIFYIPDQFDNLYKIDYSKFITGNKSKQLIAIYQELLDLWTELQDYGLIGSNYKPDFELLETKFKDNLNRLQSLL